MFPYDLTPLPPFVTWVRAKIASTINDGDTIKKDTIHISMSPTFKAMSHRAIYAYNNHIRVFSAKEHLTTSDCDVATTFEQECILGLNDQRSILAKLEYVGRLG